MEPDSTVPTFDLSGGSLPLDFANTWADRARPESDALRSFAALLAFARGTGIAADADAERLERVARRDPPAAARVLAEARALRDAIYRLFAARARGRPAATADLERLNQALRESLPHLRVEPRGDGFAWGWSDAERDLASVLRPIVRAAAELLVGDDLRRVRECDGERCTWLFLDHSRGRSRRWCSMASCGNRAKARRHYARARGAAGEPPGPAS
jgi:predicted RNA-binding Zn ribbon-like protein